MIDSLEHFSVVIDWDSPSIHLLLPTLSPARVWIVRLQLLNPVHAVFIIDNLWIFLQFLNCKGEGLHLTKRIVFEKLFLGILFLFGLLDVQQFLLSFQSGDFTHQCFMVCGNLLDCSLHLFGTRWFTVSHFLLGLGSWLIVLNSLLIHIFIRAILLINLSISFFGEPFWNLHHQIHHELQFLYSSTDEGQLTQFFDLFLIHACSFLQEQKYCLLGFLVHHHGIEGVRVIGFFVVAFF